MRIVSVCHPFGSCSFVLRCNRLLGVSLSPIPSCLQMIVMANLHGNIFAPSAQTVLGIPSWLIKMESFRTFCVLYGVIVRLMTFLFADFRTASVLSSQWPKKNKWVTENYSPTVSDVSPGNLESIYCIYCSRTDLSWWPTSVLKHCLWIWQCFSMLQ